MANPASTFAIPGSENYSAQEMEVVLVGLALAFGSGFASQYIASARGHSKTWYFWLGFFLPIIGILVAFGSPQVESTSETSTTGSPSPPPTRSASLSSELAQVAHLHESGALTDEEFQSAKRRLIEGQDK